MPKANNRTVYKKDCPFCPNKSWDIKHMNDNEKCKKYAHCECGGVFRSPNNQNIFDEGSTMEIPEQPSTNAGTQETPPIVKNPTMEQVHNENEQQESTPPKEPKRVGSGWGAVIRGKK